ncbi:MAG TPA: hypothetical protein VKZ87_10885 [Ferrovibrio sp.]|jgi:hypothetical protein|uniref:hypothetical protein n=1 Tax=Ferrovibrio sp. TaxID=1917215 RepID=UPI002B4B2DD6|nr:hypothetical protein [Ferrovibrio sp.]HLT77883.1 hypothetical protein [Ferrovibrio sp.]
MSKPTKKKKPKINPNASHILFDVIYQDGSQTSNRRVPVSAFGPLDDEEDVARAQIEQQDREIAEKSGRPRGPIKSIARSANQ